MTEPSGESPRGRVDEDMWFVSGAPVPEDYVDPALAGEDDGGGVWGQQAVLLLVAAFAVFLSVQYIDDLRYAFSPAEPVDLNAGADESTRLAPEWFDAEGQLVLPSKRYVTVSGVPQRRSLSADREYFNLIGSPLYVEVEVNDTRPRILRDQAMPVERGMEDVRPLYEGGGRVIAFTDLPQRYEGLVRFYSDAYRVEFCGFEPSQTLRTFQDRLRREAEVALMDALGRAPTEAEIAARAGATVRCQRGYLLLDGQRPADFRYLAAVYAAFVLIIAGAGAHLLRTRRGRA